MTGLIRAVLFDFGGTLMYSKEPWDPILTKGYQDLADSLCRQGFQLDCNELPCSVRYHLDRYFHRRERDLVETTYVSVIRELLAEHGYPKVDKRIIRNALDAFYAHTQPNWILEDDASHTLKSLKDGGYRLGLVSNAGDNQDVLQLVARFKISSFFDFILTSALCTYRKPHPRIFEMAMARWNIPPKEIVMVGDSLDADIMGAQKLGMYGVWITRRVTSPTPRRNIRPEAEIKTLLELPPLVSRLAK